MTELSVYDYFVNIRNIPLCYSGDLPCIIVGNPKRPTYIPLEVILCRITNQQLQFSIISQDLYVTNEFLTLYLNATVLQLCSLVSLQHYPKALTTLQPGSLVEKSKQKPQDRMTTLTNVILILSTFRGRAFSFLFFIKLLHGVCRVHKSTIMLTSLCCVPAVFLLLISSLKQMGACWQHLGYTLLSHSPLYVLQLMTFSFLIITDTGRTFRNHSTPQRSLEFQRKGLFIVKLLTFLSIIHVC